ncbi:zf-C3HC-domain-containing protein [Laetiporus sulphureus 93-53]|uniref:Zf-C3HC-domain-containing protein n=1 Tax=Laetiporus sulphureus 93-53 TaxID=1314785 RepID=A0A165CD86_9APHY|nr:zf-C3HC-domain-containing protein [Laetiporus sulphureus 93-53]KZT02602.1 zf-C3HC-domain-containing protein [Laetiporus sulphureus 93-53]
MATIPTVASVSSAPAMTTTISSGSSDKGIKRKLEDAILSLDEAVGPSYFTLDQRPPTKKARTGRSFYSTLARYGVGNEIKSTKKDLDYLYRNAPHLAAIVSRAATRARSSTPYKLSHVAKTTTKSFSADYRPSSLQSFLLRLSTYKLSTYANKPPAIDAVAAAKCGWINDGKDRLVCGICSVSWVVAGREGLNRDAANALLEKQRVQLVDMHKDGCPWKTRQCDPTIYRIPLHTPLAMARDVKARAVALDTVLQDVEIKHPLTPAQIHSLLSIISSVPLLQSANMGRPARTESANTDGVADSPEPSETAVITSLFGWSVLPSSPSSERVRTSSHSSSDSSAASSWAHSRTSSVASLRDGTSTLSPSRLHRSPQIPSPIRSDGSPPVAVPSLKPDTTLLHCALCQRRIGLWAFISPPQTNDHSNGPGATGNAAKAKAKMRPKRQLDVLREHRSYCPYVIRSTTVPSLPAQPSGDAGHTTTPSTTVQVNEQIEGWRAVLTVVLRHGMARRQRLGAIRHTSTSRLGASNGAEATGSGIQAEEVQNQMNAVEAMVAGVKSRGGKDVLHYVRGLLR